MNATKIKLIVFGGFHRAGEMSVDIKQDENGEIQISHATAVRIRRHIDCGRSKNRQNRCDCFRVLPFLVIREDDPIRRPYLDKELRNAVFEKLGIEQDRPIEYGANEDYVIS